MSEPRPRVVLLSIDGLSHSALSATTTPCLWDLGASGGRAPRGGRCDLPAVTYVSHATLITGTRPITHGLTSNMAAAPRPGVVPGWAGEARVQVPTLFSALRQSGLRAAAICGDQYLYQIMGAHDAAVAWPPGGALPAGTPLCAAGYATNAATREPLLAAIADQDMTFVFGHLNESDTWGHLYGPAHEETRRAYAAADALVGEVAAALRPRWEQTVLIALSDHGMEAVNGSFPVDLMAGEPVRAVLAEVVNDGGAALARLRDGVTPAEAGAVLLAVPGVVSSSELRPGTLLVVGEPGAVFAAGPAKVRHGVHGGPGSTITTAIVGGGHPAVSRIASALTAEPPHLRDWAPTIAAILDVPFPSAEGRNLSA